MAGRRHLWVSHQISQVRSEHCRLAGCLSHQSFRTCVSCFVIESVGRKKLIVDCHVRPAQSRFSRAAKPHTHANHCPPRSCGGSMEMRSQRMALTRCFSRRTLPMSLGMSSSTLAKLHRPPGPFVLAYGNFLKLPTEKCLAFTFPPSSDQGGSRIQSRSAFNNSNCFPRMVCWCRTTTSKSEAPAG